MKSAHRLIVLVIVLVLAGGCGGSAVGDGEEALSNEGTDNFDEGSSGVVGEVKAEAVAEANGAVAVDAGFAADGVRIGIPDGFLSTECKFTAAVSQVDGRALSTSVSISNTGVVTCRQVIQEEEDLPAESQGCVASYTIVCVNSE